MKIKRKYICIFCNKRHDASDMLCYVGHIGACRGCLSKLSPVPHPPAFAGIGDLDYIISPFFYKGRLSELIKDMKFKGSSAYADVLSQLMCSFLNDVTQLADFDCVVPVPLSKRRLTERGYNQSALLAKPFAEFFGLSMREDLLFKIRETERQSRVSVELKYTNLKDAFRAEEAVKNKRILLLDDICTTGSTLRECAVTLKSAGAQSIVAVTLAIKDKKE